MDFGIRVLSNLMTNLNQVDIYNVPVKSPGVVFSHMQKEWLVFGRTSAHHQRGDRIGEVRGYS